MQVVWGGGAVRLDGYSGKEILAGLERELRRYFGGNLKD